MTQRKEKFSGVGFGVLRRANLLLSLVFMLVAGFSLPVAAQQIENFFPYKAMMLTGNIYPDTAGKVVPADGDEVIAYIGSTKVASDVVKGGGTFYTLLVGGTVSVTDNATLTLRLNHAGTIYALRNNDSRLDAMVPFSGGSIGSMPSKTVNLEVVTFVVSGGTGSTGTGGTGTGGTGTGGTGTGGSTSTPTPGSDVNGDGTVDDADISLLKRAISGELPINKSKMDVNGDGVVNTRDLIELIRTVRDKSRAALRR